MTVTTTTLTSRRAESAGLGRPRLLGRAVGAVTFPAGLVATALATLAASAILASAPAASSPSAPGRQPP
jgi:hypothetical protein